MMSNCKDSKTPRMVNIITVVLSVDDDSCSGAARWLIREENRFRSFNDHRRRGYQSCRSPSPKLTTWKRKKKHTRIIVRRSEWVTHARMCCELWRILRAVPDCCCARDLTEWDAVDAATRQVLYYCYRDAAATRGESYSGSFSSARPILLVYVNASVLRQVRL